MGPQQTCEPGCGDTDSAGATMVKMASQGRGRMIRVFIWEAVVCAMRDLYGFLPEREWHV
jgi:hypothetical protein